MNIERQWKAALLKRVTLNAFAGALLAALVGALCGLMVSGLVVWVERSASIALKILSAPEFGAIITNAMTAGLAMLGALLGAIILAVAATRAKPGALMEPLLSLIGRVLLGQIAGTVGFCSLFLVVAGARASLSGQSFYLAAMNDSGWLFVGAPVMMLCGAIAGAFSKRA